MKLIALDQNAISNLAFPPSAVWSDILVLLINGVARRALLCPTSTVTISESVHLERARRNSIHRVSLELSQGYFFRFPWEIIALEALAKVRPGIDAFPLWVPENRREAEDAFYSAASREIRNEGTAFEAGVNLPAEERGATKLGSGPSNESPIEYLGYLLAVDWLKMVRGHLNKLRNGQMIGDDQFMIQQICATFLRLGVTDNEITGLLRSIRVGEWLEIRILECWFALDGLFAYDQLSRGRRLEYNDQWDKFRAGEAFHCADCFITDRAMASALRQLKFTDPEDFQVFSVRETKDILAYLKALA